MTAPPENPGKTGERIAKLLARAGVASRREIERMIAEGRIQLNGAPVTTPATILTDLSGITVDGAPVQAPEATRLFLFHKPSGLITAERDPAGRPTIYTALRNALPAGAPRVMPVGRLDLNTEGLLLLTNDGELKRAMELPSSLVPRTYRARTYGDISQARLEELIEGIEIDGMRYGKIDANMERRTGRNQWIELTLTEGKNREVRRVLEHLGLEVSRLLRIAYGPFILGDLARGAAGEIAPADVEKFRRTLGLAAQDAGTVRRTVRLETRPRAKPAPPPRAYAKPQSEPTGNRRAAPRGRPEGARPSTAPGERPATPQPTARPTRPIRRRDDDRPLLGRDEVRGKGPRSPQTQRVRAADDGSGANRTARPAPRQSGPGGPDRPQRPGRPGGKPRGRRP